MSEQNKCPNCGMKLPQFGGCPACKVKREKNQDGTYVPPPPKK